MEPSKKVVPAEQLILDRLTQIEARLSRSSEIGMVAELNRRSHGFVESGNALVDYNFTFKPDTGMEKIIEISDYFRQTYRSNAGIIDTKNGQFILSIKLDSSYNFDAKTTKTLINSMPSNIRDAIQRIDITIG